MYLSKDAPDWWRKQKCGENDRYHWVCFPTVYTWQKSGIGRNWVTVSGYMPYRRRKVDTFSVTTSYETLIPPLQILSKMSKPGPKLGVWGYLKWDRGHWFCVLGFSPPYCLHVGISINIIARCKTWQIKLLATWTKFTFFSDVLQGFHGIAQKCGYIGKKCNAASAPARYHQQIVKRLRN